MFGLVFRIGRDSIFRKTNIWLSCQRSIEQKVIVLIEWNRSIQNILRLHIFKETKAQEYVCEEMNALNSSWWWSKLNWVRPTCSIRTYSHRMSSIPLYNSPNWRLGAQYLSSSTGASHSSCTFIHSHIQLQWLNTSFRENVYRVYCLLIHEC